MRPRGHEGVRLRSPPARSRDYRFDRHQDSYYRLPRSMSPPRRDSSRRSDNGYRRLKMEEHPRTPVDRSNYTRRLIDEEGHPGRDRLNRIADEGVRATGGHHRSPSRERRDYGGHIGSEEEADLRRRYLSHDVTNVNMEMSSKPKHNLQVDITHRNTRQKEFLSNESSALVGNDLVRKSMRSDAGTVESSFFSAPPDYGYPLGPSHTTLSSGKIGGMGTFSSSTVAGNSHVTDADYVQYRSHNYENSLSRTSFDEGGGKPVYLKDVSYPRAPLVEVRDFGGSSSSRARDDLFSYPPSGRLGIGDEGFKDNGHGYDNTFDYSEGLDSRSKGFEPYRGPSQNPARDASFKYDYSAVMHRDIGNSRATSEELHQMARSPPRKAYTYREPSGSSFLDTVGDRIGDISNSQKISTDNNLLDHPSISKYSIERFPSGLDGRGDLMGSESVNFYLRTKASEDCDIVSSRNDYGIGRDSSMLNVYGERFRSPQRLRHDSDMFKYDSGSHGRSGEELPPYHPFDRSVGKKYPIDDKEEYIPEASRPNARSIFNRMEEIHNKDILWVAEEPNRSLPSNRLGRKMPARPFGGTYETSGYVSTPGKRGRHEVLQLGSPRGKFKSSYSVFQKRFPMDNKRDVNKNFKFQKGGFEDRHNSKNMDDDYSSERTVPHAKPDPPEGSEEFKQLVQKAFLRYCKHLNENPVQQRRYLEQGKNGSLLCMICGRLSKEFGDAHALVAHTFTSLKGLRTEHLGLHKALCVMLGWNSSMTPDVTKAYQSMPAAEVAALKADLILWPPVVIIHNSSIGNMTVRAQEVVTNERLEEMLRGMGCGGGKTKVCLGKPDHSLLLVKFLPTFSGLQEAERLHKYYAENKRGRDEFQQISSQDGGGVRRESAEPEKVDLFLYGYLGSAEDLCKLDHESKRRCLIKSKKEIDAIADATLKGD